MLPHLTVFINAYVSFSCILHVSSFCDNVTRILDRLFCGILGLAYCWQHLCFTSNNTYNVTHYIHALILGRDLTSCLDFGEGPHVMPWFWGGTSRHALILGRDIHHGDRGVHSWCYLNHVRKLKVLYALSLKNRKSSCNTSWVCLIPCTCIHESDRVTIKSKKKSRKIRSKSSNETYIVTNLEQFFL